MDINEKTEVYFHDDDEVSIRQGNSDHADDLVVLSSQEAKRLAKLILRKNMSD